MYDYLVDHALRNVWCAPRQDLQAIVKPARLTPEGGVWNTIKIQWDTINLPIRLTRFHVFQIGQLHPALMGLFNVSNKWVKLSDACERMNLITDVYSISGIQMPRLETWYLVTETKNLVLAIKHQENIPIHCGKEPVYLRVYTNAFFGSYDNAGVGNGILVRGGVPTTRPELLALQNDYETLKTRPGGVYAFVNGSAVSDLDLLTATTGDYVEYVYDPSIKRVVKFPVKSLPTFVSTLDKKRKYLLHYAGGKVDTIDYHDDIDFYLMGKIDPTRMRGVYYHRNSAEAIRMVTHRDYSTPVDYLVSFAKDFTNWVDPEEAYLVMHVREGGWRRNLVYENNRIHELYKLSDADISAAMLGVDSLVDNWRAEVLEASTYTELMRKLNMQFTREQVEKAYGYNACSKVLADTPSMATMVSGQLLARVPYGMQSGATGYEYNGSGKLLGWYTHLGGLAYSVRNTRTKYVELLNYFIDDRLAETYDSTKVALDSNESYRFYTCPILGGVPTYEWEDVTGSSKYTIIGNELTWLVDPATTYTLVRGDSLFLGYEFEYKAKDGVIRFPIKHRVRRNSIVSTIEMEIPLGQLKVWLNGHELIESLDYNVDFPTVIITNKKYLVGGHNATQKIAVRFTGFCDSKLNCISNTDVGFVDHGVLSRNKRFDIRDDKVLHINVGGGYKDRSELVFSEDSTNVKIGNTPNGTPYQINYVIVPLRSHIVDDTYDFMLKSMVIDEKISDYLSLKIPDEIITTPSPIAERYQVISPFCCKLMWDLKNKVLTDERLYQHYNDDVVRDICKDYMWLLNYDPTQEAAQVDDRYVVIHPHELSVVVPLNIYHYKLLYRAVKLFLNDKVILSNQIRLYEPEETQE